LPRERVADVGEVGARELLDDPWRGRLVGREVGALGRRDRREPEGERMPPGKPIDARGVRTRHAELLEQGEGIARLERPERHAAEARGAPRRGAPGARRRLAADQEQAHVRGQGRHEHLPQPGVHQAEHLVGVQREHDAAPQPPVPPAGLFGGVAGATDRGGQLVKHAPRGRLDAPTVEPDHGGAGRPGPGGQRVEERRLPDAAQTVHMDHGRLGVLDLGEQPAKLGPAADERRAPEREIGGPPPQGPPPVALTRRRSGLSRPVATLQAPTLRVAPGTVEAAAAHIVLLLPRLRLAHDQRTRVGKRLDALLEQLAKEEGPDGKSPDVTILQSLPGVGRVFGNGSRRGRTAPGRARLPGAAYAGRCCARHPPEREEGRR
jgi:hypothetical protein